jgi:hypothetical protein
VNIVLVSFWLDLLWLINTCGYTSPHVSVSLTNKIAYVNPSTSSYCQIVLLTLSNMLLK